MNSHELYRQLDRAGVEPVPPHGSKPLASVWTGELCKGVVTPGGANFFTERIVKVQLWPEIPVTNKTPFMECILPFVTSYNC